MDPYMVVVHSNFHFRMLGKRRSIEHEDADDQQLVGLSAARYSALPPSTGNKCRKFQHGFRPLGRSKHGKSHMTHDIGLNRNYNSSYASNEMAEARRKRLQELLKKPGNNICAECGKKSKSAICKHSTVRSIVLVFVIAEIC